MVTWRFLVSACLAPGLGAGGAVPAAPHGADVEDRIAAVDATLAQLADKVDHQGSSSYWHNIRTPPQPLPIAVAASEPLEARLRALQQRLEDVAARMTSDDAGNRGSQIYWQDAAPRVPQVASVAQVRPMGAAAQARGCLGEAQEALALAVREAAEVHKEAAGAPSLDDRMAVAEDKLKCAMSHLTVNDVQAGSSEYWGRSFDGAVMGDDRMVAVGALFVCSLVVGSVAAIASLASLPRAAPLLSGGVQEPLLQA